MKVSTILSLLGLLSTSIAAPSHSGKKDVNIFLYEPASDHVEASMVPRLWPGYYIISSPALNRDFVIGRGLFEDHSLKPKEVKTVPRWDDRGQTKWKVQPLGGSLYSLSVGPNNWQAPVANINGKLFAVLDGSTPPGEWIIEYQEAYNAFTIVSANENSPGLGWVANPEPEQQVSVRPLIVAPSFPPKFPPTQLFTFRPVFNNDMASTKKAGLNIEVTDEDL